MKNFRNRLCFLVFALMFIGASVENTIAQQSAPSLSAMVLFGIPSLNEMKQNPAQKQDECLQRYLTAVPAKSFLWSSAVPSGPEDILNYRRRNLQEQIVVIMGDEAHSEAKAFSEAVPLYIEWEGRSENPLNEANFIDNWLMKRPGTPIAAFLYIFKAHRLRAGYEAARAKREKGLWPVLALQYNEALEKAASFHHPLISCIAKDLKGQPYVYMEGYERP